MASSPRPADISGFHINPAITTGARNAGQALRSGVIPGIAPPMSWHDQRLSLTRYFGGRLNDPGVTPNRPIRIASALQLSCRAQSAHSPSPPQRCTPPSSRRVVVAAGAGF
jgi:hypothetical protein